MTLCKIVFGDCTDLLKDGIEEMRTAGLMPVIVTDPPFNIGYRYKSYKDKMPEGEYYKWLASLTSECASVIIHYPESLHKISIAKGEAPIKVATWVYNSNTAKQHRDIACALRNVPFIGYEIDSDYCTTAQRRIFGVVRD